MQALVRVQARVRANRVRMSTDGQAVQKLLEARRANLDPLKEAEVQFTFFYVFELGMIIYPLIHCLLHPELVIVI